MTHFRLYHYWRSSASWRARWALLLKKVECEFVPVNLLDGEQKNPAYLEKNPTGNVPALEILEKGKPSRFLGESIAIIEWLEENFPKPNLLPSDSFARAQVRQITQMINAGIQPLQNLKVCNYYSDDTEKKKEWNRHWVRNGLSALELMLKKTAGKFCIGDTITIADLCLIPQCYSARRFEVSPEGYPTIARIEKTALETPACQASHPDRFKP